MPSITIKNIPDKIYKELKIKAAQNKRSLNNEVLFCLESYLDNRMIDVEELIKEVKKIRAGILNKISNKEVIKAKKSGRK